MSEQQSSEETDSKVNLGEVSVFANAMSTDVDQDIEIREVLKAIRTGEWESEINQLRWRCRQKMNDVYDKEKKNLISISLSAVLTTRKSKVPLKEKLTKHSGWLQGDFDAKDHDNFDLEKARQDLINDPHVGFVFLSPSGAGLKAGIRIDGSRHKESFFAAEKHFLKKYGLKLDKSVKDVCRLCFVSYDPDLWQCDELPEPLPIPQKTQSSRKSKSGTLSYPPTTATDIEEMLSCIPSRPDYDAWLRVSSAVWSELSFDEGTRLLSNWSPEEKEGEYREKYANKLDSIGIGTLVHMAKEHGYQPKRIRKGRTLAPRSENVLGEHLVDEEFVRECFKRKQTGDAELWLDTTRDFVRFDHTLNEWRIYRNGLWQIDKRKSVKESFPDIVGNYYERLISKIDDSIGDGPIDDQDSRLDDMDVLSKRIGTVCNAPWINNSLERASCNNSIATELKEYDQKPHLLALENGVIDFEERNFRNHQGEDMLSVAAPIEYDDKATCPKFDAFLHRAMEGNEELVAYLWRAIGYSLTGYVDEDVLFFSYGSGQNGKSTLNCLLSMLLGDDLAMNMTVDLLTGGHRESDSKDYKVAMLRGKRVVVPGEIQRGSRLNEATVKTILGGEPVMGRPIKKDPIVFRPTHKIWWAGNHKPTISSTDHGIWRRIHLIPWMVQIPEEEKKRRSVYLEEMKEEFPGILNRALVGWNDYLDNGGLRPPEAVQEATNEYRTESDQVGQFLAERTEKDLCSQVKGKDLLNAYLAWCEDNNERPSYRTSRAFLPQLRERGIETTLDRTKTTMVDGLRFIGAG